MSSSNDDVIILRHTWMAASRAVQLEFLELLRSEITPPPFDAPYAAALRLWCRLPAGEQRDLLKWFETQLEKPASTPSAADKVVDDQCVQLVDRSGFVPVSTIWESRFQSYSLFTKWLNQTSTIEVRRRRPNRRRLEIFLPDWNGFWERFDMEQGHSTKAS